MSMLFYRPENAWAADFIPFYWDGMFRLFYLHDWRDSTRYGEGTPWYQVSTRDFLRFAEHGQMLARGGRGEQDLYAFTGSLVERQGTFHIFYTGHNPYFQVEGGHQQAVMHAVSDDLLHWTKLPAHTFYAPADRYEPHDWRDPFVFWNGKAGEYWMLLAARLREGPSRHRGCTALCVSRDLQTWEVRDPFWVPGLFYTHECPDLFRMGDWWYLIFSEFSERTVTRYRMSRSLNGPWLTPEEDTFDGRAWYAAKTASDGQSRFLFGWLATREHARDEGSWQWGGSLVVHEIVQRADGTLAVKPPASIVRAFQERLPLTLEPRMGRCELEHAAARVEAVGSFGCITAGQMPNQCRLSATVRFDPGARACGMMLRCSVDLESAYYVRLEPGRQRMVFDMWPRPGDKPYMAELERPIRLEPDKPVEITVLVDDTAGVVYVADEVAMSVRMYDLKGGLWGMFVQEGSAQFDGLSVATRD